MKSRKIVLIAVLILLFVSGCNNTTTYDVDEFIDNMNTGEEIERQVISYKADLVHDGMDEDVLLDITDILLDDSGIAKVSVSQNGNTIWDSEYSFRRSEWMSLFLVETEDGDYLLGYNPDNMSEQACFSYELFYFDATGEMIVKSKNSVEFDTRISDTSYNFPIEGMLDFAEEVNLYLEKATLIVGVADYVLEYSTSDDKKCYIENYSCLLDSDISDDAKTNLEEFEKKMIAERDANWTVITYNSDLNHNGMDETITLNLTEILMDQFGTAKITVSERDNTIWDSEGTFMGFEWMSIYFVETDEGDYLLGYNPDNSQGQACFSYELFYFDDNNELVVKSENSIYFDTYSSNEDYDFPIEEMLNFAEEVNQYLEKSTLIVSMVEGELTYSTSENKINYIEKFSGVENFDEQLLLKNMNGEE